MTTSRPLLKNAIPDLLSSGREHPCGHQGAYANRYLVSAAGGHAVEVVFEKSERVLANLWCPGEIATLVPDVPVKISPKSALWQLKKLLKASTPGALTFGLRQWHAARGDLTEERWQ